MNHSRTTQQADLGQCLLRASSAQLQLRFTATANFGQPAHWNSVPPVKISQWQDLSSIWVTEAPEIDIRLFLRPARDLERAVSALVADLGDKLCSSPVWLKIYCGMEAISPIDWTTDLVGSWVRRQAQGL